MMMRFKQRKNIETRFECCLFTLIGCLDEKADWQGNDGH